MIAESDSRMDPAVKAEWVAALRSGKYRQGSGSLRTQDAGSQDLFCCLGVLCEIAVGHGVVERSSAPVKEECFGYYSDTGNLPFTSYLPDSVITWAGVDMTGQYAFSTRSLAVDNDEFFSFSQIADIIEENF